MSLRKILTGLPLIHNFTLDSGSPWADSEPYKLGKRLLLALPFRNQSIEVQVVKMFPPTNSVTLLVENLGDIHDIPPRVILKLADRRFGDVRKACPPMPAWPWTIDSECHFQGGLRGYIQKHQRYPNLKSEDMEEHMWMRELRHWDTFNRLRRREQKAYLRLVDAQSRGYVPRFYGAARIHMSSEKVHPSINHIDGLLLEYIPGRTMGDLQPGTDLSFEEAEEISQKVLTLGRCLRHYGVLHNDVHLNNIILRSPLNDPVLIDWGYADISYSHIPARKNWRNSCLIHDYQTRLRILLEMDHLWHRFSTPISEEDMRRTAKKTGWKTMNYTMTSIPPDVLEKFYYRDHSVTVDTGLQWKVKPHIKTRHLSDPFQSLPEKLGD